MVHAASSTSKKGPTMLSTCRTRRRSTGSVPKVELAHDIQRRQRRMHREIAEQDANGTRHGNRAKPQSNRPIDPAGDLQKEQVEGGHRDRAEKCADPKCDNPLWSGPEPQQHQVREEATDDRNRDQLEVLLQRAEQRTVQADQEGDAAKGQPETTE